MNLKLLDGLACSMALLLGSCSGDNAPSSAVRSVGVAKADFGGNGGSGSAEPTELDKANAAHSEAESAVALARAAISEAERANTEEARDRARALISAALAKLADAVAAAEEAVEAARNGGAAAALGAAARVKAKADNLLNARTAAFASALDFLAWYGRHLVRYRLANGEAVMPREGANVASIVRIPRTKDDDGDGVQEPNPDAFTSTTFKDVMYAEGKRVFAVAADGGDEFKVDGYTVVKASTYFIDDKIYTGLRLTNAGLVIRTGGTDPDAVDSFEQYYDDFTDFRRKITSYTNDTDGDGFVLVADGISGQNGWDLEIAFDEPHALSVPVNYDNNLNPVSSWTGNGAFYWKSLVTADPSQLDEDGDYYDANAFNQSAGYRDLGTYEVWLSNHIGVDKNLEPLPGQGPAVCLDGSKGLSCPSDDVNMYLDYAAYGLFVYTADVETYRNGYNGQIGRINTIHFGYSAFGTGDGQRTADIGEAITNGRFEGYALAYEVKGASNEGPIETELLRGDVTLTVNIPKGSGSATLQGTMNNFQMWNSEQNYWADYTDNFAVALNSAAISDDGTFDGTTAATPVTGLDGSGLGVYKGSFYGPRAEKNDLEIAGSWTIGSDNNYCLCKDLYGSFGAKQKPPSVDR